MPPSLPCSGFLELATETRFRRILLEEGPVALGWRRWRELDHQYTALLLERLLGDLVDAGEIAPTSWECSRGFVARWPVRPHSKSLRPMTPTRPAPTRSRLSATCSRAFAVAD
ncbi:MAG: hypothetical protein V7646_6957 [Pseudonocardia sp.]